MMRVTVETKLSDVLALPELGGYARYLMYSPKPMEGEERLKDAKLRDLAAIGWSPEGVAAGLNCFLKALEEGRAALYPVYPDPVRRQDPEKGDVCLIRLLPHSPDPRKPAVVLCAGGAYRGVCTLVESLPTARHLLDRGYTVFAMNYRVSCSAAALQALDDLAEAVGYLESHAEELGLDPFRYAIGGYSAGANLISNWGCASIGWKKYGRAKPVCMFPVYTFIDLKAESRRDANGGLLGTMFGSGWREIYERYDAADLIDGDCPPCYIVCGKDDAVVPCRNSELMKEKLDAAGVRAVLEEGEHAQHGFGDGTGTDVEGWPGRAAAFMESLL